MKYSIGLTEFEAEGKYLTLSLRDSTELLGDPEAMRGRLETDGYLFLRAIHDRDAVVRARRSILLGLQDRNLLHPDAPFMEGVMRPDCDTVSSSVRGNESLKTDALKAVVYGQPVLDFFAQLFGETVASFQFQWLRTVGRNASSAVHCDAPFMSRGSQRLLTCWTPLGDLTPDMGTLALCLGSHRWGNVISTYGQSDVDRDLTTGAFTEDPAELVDRFGGRWATSEFRMGDIVVFGRYSIHASLTNTSDRFRISCDTRYQPASDPMDERWAGTKPAGHDRFWAADVQLEPTEVSRRRWGL